MVCRNNNVLGKTVQCCSLSLPWESDRTCWIIVSIFNIIYAKTMYTYPVPVKLFTGNKISTYRILLRYEEWLVSIRRRTPRMLSLWSRRVRRGGRLPAGELRFVSLSSIRTHLFTAYNPSSEITLKVIDELVASTISICIDLKPMIELESKSYWSSCVNPCLILHPELPYVEPTKSPMNSL